MTLPGLRMNPESPMESKIDEFALLLEQQCGFICNLVDEQEKDEPPNVHPGPPVVKPATSAQRHRPCPYRTVVIVKK